MDEPAVVLIEVPSSEVAGLMDELRSACGDDAVTAEAPVGRPSPGTAQLLGRDRRMHSIGVDVIILAVLAASPGVIRALAPALREYVRLKRTTVHVHRSDGSRVEVSGNLSTDDLHRILNDDDTTHRLPAGKEAAGDAQ